MKKAIDLTKEQIAPLNSSEDMKEYLDQELVIHSIDTSKKSKYGNLLYAEVSIGETGDQFKMFIRGMKVQERLEWIENNSSFPVEATFIKVGGSYEIK